jgi:glycosyltransferase involved in cell wall biosynthesis
MSVYHKDNHLLFLKAVDSIFNNTLKPNQIIIIIDGPLSIFLKKIIINLRKKYPKKIQWIRLRTNLGLARALNHGLKYIKYTWVVRADADDFNLPERFEVLSKIVNKKPNLDLLGSSILEVDTNGKILGYKHNPTSKKEIKQTIKFRSPFNHMSVAYKLKSVLSVGGYPDIFLKEDYGLWCKFVSKKMRFINTRTILVHATAGDEMVKRRGGIKYALSEYQIQLLIARLGLNSFFLTFLIGISRAAIFLAPFPIRKFIYTNLLRDKNS